MDMNINHCSYTGKNDKQLSIVKLFSGFEQKYLSDLQFHLE